MAASTFLATDFSFCEPAAKKDDSRSERDLKKPVLTVEQARDRAKLLHTTYESTLIVVHRAYFEEGKRMMVPARVLEDVFYWGDEENNGETRWISVNTKAMNIAHEAETEVEKQAARVLASGRKSLNCSMTESIIAPVPSHSSPHAYAATNPHEFKITTENVLPDLSAVFP